MKSIYTQPSVLIALLASGLLLLSCGGDDTPSDPFNVGIARTVTMAPYTRVQPAGGEVTSLSLGPAGEIVAVVDGDLLRIPRGEEGVTIDDGRSYRWGSVLADGGILGVTESAIVHFPAGSSSPNVTPFEPVGAGESILAVRSALSPDGNTLVLVVVSDVPQTRAWYSVDNGQSWSQLIFEGGEEYLRNRGDLAYLASGVLVAADAGGLFATTDNGATWSERTRLMPNRGIALLAASESQLFRYSPGEGGLAVSTDGGQTFLDVWFNALPPFFYQIREGSGGELLALGNRTRAGGTTPISRPMSLYRSTDQGRNWTELLPVSANALATRNGTTGLALASGPVAGGPQPGGIALSVDREINWERLPLDGGTEAAPVDEFSFAEEGDLLVLSNGGIYRNSSLRLNFVSAPFGAVWVAGGADGAVYWQTSSGTFRLGAPGGAVEVIEGVESGAVAYPLRDGSVLLAGEKRLDRYSESGGLQTLNSEGYSFERIVEEKGGVLAATVQGEGLRSGDGGVTWGPSSDLVGVACNGEGGCILQVDGAWHLLAGDGKTLSPLDFIGLPVPVGQIGRIAYDRRDRLWVLLQDGRLYASDNVVR